MKDIRKFAATSNMVRVKILDSSVTTGAGLTGLTYASSGLVIDVIANNAASGATYHYKSAATATIQDIGTTGSTCGTYSAPSASNCRFAPVDATNFPGLYEIQFLDGLFDDTSCTSLIGEVKGPANCTPTTFEIRLSTTDLLDVADGLVDVDVEGWNGSAVVDDLYDLLGIVAIGTAQSVDATHIQLAASTSITDDVIIGATVHVYSSTNGFHERRIITDWVSSTDTATVDAWTQTPTGTIKYIVYATAPGSTSSPIPADLRQIGGVTQSATDLKDFADTGYDPSTHVTGPVNVGRINGATVAGDGNATPWDAA